MAAFEDNPMGIDFDFENPVEVEEQIVETTGISMGEEDLPKEEETEIELPDSKTGFSLGSEEEVEEVQTETKVTPKEEEKEDFGDLEALSEVAPTLANLLYEKGHITELPDGVDPDQFSLEDFWKTVDHNIKKKEEGGFLKGVQYEQTRIVNKLPDIAKDILAYSLGDNLEDGDVLAYIESLTRSRSLKELSPENTVDAEKIITEYYKANGWTKDEIEDKVNALIEGDLLLKEAKLVKPKLDSQAESIARAKVEEQQKIAQYDKQMQEHLDQRVRSILDTGKLKNIDLSKDELVFLYNAVMNNEVPVTLKGGKQVEMGLAEYLVRKNKYDTKEGNLENLLLGLLVMQNGYDAIERFVAKAAREKETSLFVREQKFSNAKKKGSSTPSQQKERTGGFILRVK